MAGRDRLERGEPVGRTQDAASIPKLYDRVRLTGWDAVYGRKVESQGGSLPSLELHRSLRVGVTVQQ
jgi:hypothetical protein